MGKPAKQFYQVGMLIKEHRLMKKSTRPDSNDHMSQEELAHALNFKSGQYISNIERGISGIPHKNLGKLSIVLGLPLSKIMDAMVEDFKINVMDQIRE